MKRTLAILALVSSVASCGGKTKQNISAVFDACTVSTMILDQKRSCGFTDLNFTTAIGTVVSYESNPTDGDETFNLLLDPEFAPLLIYQGRVTSPTLHIEVTPCENRYLDMAQKVAEVKRRWKAESTLRVEVSGRWSYDGVDHRGDEITQISECLDGRLPDPAVGWTEIHPAYQIKILN